VLIAEAARSERGITLVETLVAISMGVIVIGATMAILTISLHQSTMLTDRIQADQASRTTMTKVVNALHSSCLAPGFTPVQAESGASKLIFVNAYSSIAAIPSASESVGEGAYKHVTEYVAGANGKIIDKAYPSTSVASWPEITFSNVASKTTVLGEHISQTGATPVFQYYKYAERSSSESENAAVSTLEPLLSKPATETLNATTAKQAASVLISFNTKPRNGDTRASRSVDLKNQVTFAFSAPSAETPIADSPCE
jgi:hypothetical protein